MADIFSYKGKRVAIMGCFSGTGEACARQLVEMGAEVHGCDIKPSPVEGLASFTHVDLKDPASIDAGIASIGGELDGIFNVSGLPQTFPAVDVVTVNFFGLRYWTEQWIPKMKKGGAIVTVSSLAGAAWLENQEKLNGFLAITDFDEARAWVEAHPEEVGDPYSFGKELINLWTQQSALALVEKDLRINCTMPSPIDSPMLKDFEQVAGNAVMSAFSKARGRHSTPQEQAWPLILLNSDAATFINGVCLPVDSGLAAGLGTGQLNIETLIAEASA